MGGGGALLPGEEPLSVSGAEVVSLLESALQKPKLAAQCRDYALTALMKLSARVPDQADRIKARAMHSLAAARTRTWIVLLCFSYVTILVVHLLDGCLAQSEMR